MRYIIRKKRGRGHIYYNSETKKEIKNKDVLNYVKSLVIPPAWSDTVIVYPTIKKIRQIRQLIQQIQNMWLIVKD